MNRQDALQQAKEMDAQLRTMYEWAMDGKYVFTAGLLSCIGAIFEKLIDGLANASEEEL